ncbi:hypothetical protein LX64_03264 [Chitinophaga skermanii]|uniref:Beta-barrel porin n=1 Tax=Chitinophaga skermanii TaxID=331697 RepID=A0A327QE23_9BACT|nr:hypothetical protein [Chitinophaga skermanii]RAJ02255.1 hypothetical protein LX64_03264 [Chitinophaga skermanii]
MPKRSLFVYILILFSIPAWAQQFGGNRPAHRWMQIDTSSLRVIFPKALYKDGQHVANLLSYIAAKPSTIGPMRRKVDIVLQNESLLANGYVQLGPFRSEFYMTPPPNSQDLGALYWTDQLAIHEFRHVLQNANARKGISNVFSYLGGQLGQAAITNIALPNWFWEGDAVVTETALSLHGRGRLSNFYKGFRGLTFSRKQYNYMKIRNGSYRDYVPDHYAYGYIMTAYGRTQYGQNFWPKVMDEAVRFKGVFYPFSQSLKRHTGMNAAHFYKAALASYQAQWTAAAAHLSSTKVDTITPLEKQVANYNWINATNNGWIVVKNTYKTIPAFYRLHDNGKEEKIFAPGYNFDDYFHVQDNWIVYTESRNHPRWGYENYSIIRLHDINTGKTRKLTSKSRYFSPSLSHDVQNIVAVRQENDMKVYLDIVDANSGERKKTLANPADWYYTYPRYMQNDSAVVSTVRDRNGNMGMIAQNVYTDQVDTLVAFTANVLGAVNPISDTILFTANYKDVSNGFALLPGTQQVVQLTDRANNVNAIAARNGEIRFSEFTSQGDKIFASSIQSATPFNIYNTTHAPYLAPTFGEDSLIVSHLPERTFTTKKYSQFRKFINLHSWIPTFDDPEYSFTIYGNNILNTTQTALSYTYNNNEQSHKVGGSLVYAQLFPYLSAGLNYTANRHIQVSRTEQLVWNETNANVGVALPFNLSSGKFGRSMGLSGSYNYVQRTEASGSKYQFKYNNLQYFSTAFTFNQQRMKARQNLFSHFGQNFLVQYSRSVSNAAAQQLYAKLDLYLPGFMRNHNIVINTAYQYIDTASAYRFTDNFVYARGYNKPFYSKIYKIGVNYHFPIAYPDWGFANLLYFMRIRGNLFYDYSRTTNVTYNGHGQYNSTGGELFFDTKIGNTIPFTFGARFSHLLDPDPQDAGLRNKFEFIIPLQQLFSY